MAITDPQIIKFANEVLRPCAEKLSAAREDLARGDIRWNEIKALVPNDAAEMLEDGREGEGISRLNGQEITQVMTILRRLQDFFDNETATITVPANVQTKLAKPMVRTLRGI